MERLLKAINWILLSAIIVLPYSALADTTYDIKTGGYALRDLLDTMQVEDHWLAQSCVKWQDGSLISTNQKTCDSLGLITLSHCSAFVAAVINYKLGYPFLTPNDYSFYTSNWQANWLAGSQGTENGWQEIQAESRDDIYIEAQLLANKGCLVVASYKNPQWQPNSNDEGLAGHIAIIRPSTRFKSTLVTKGPQETQAGMENYNSAPLIWGFGSYEMAHARFFWHISPYCSNSLAEP